jgi:circadian clock protein KaiC
LERKFKGIETMVDGLDNILDGGIPSKSQMLIAGGPGTGKTLLSLEVLYNCSKNGIPSAFIAFDQRPSDIIKNAKNTFAKMTDIDDLTKNRLLTIDGYDLASKVATNVEDESTYSMSGLISEVEGIAKNINAEVVAIDSLSFLKLMLGKTLLYSKTVSSLISILRRHGATSIFTLDIPYYSMNKMKFGQELILFDGVLALYQEHEDMKTEFIMQVVKMRGNSHSRSLSHYEITPGGIKFK